MMTLHQKSFVHAKFQLRMNEIRTEGHFALVRYTTQPVLLQECLSTRNVASVFCFQLHTVYQLKDELIALLGSAAIAIVIEWRLSSPSKGLAAVY